MDIRLKKDRPKVAVASRSFSDTAMLRSELSDHFPEVRYNHSGTTLEGDDLIEFAAGAAAVVVGLESIDDALLESLPNLRYISKYGVGLNNIDLEACHERGVRVLHSPGVNSYSVSELTLSSAIHLLHRAPESQSSLQSGIWQQHRGRDLRGAVVGIIGCGHVGKELVQLLSPFDCKVLVFDKVNYNAFNKQWGVNRVPLEQLLAESDVVTIHLPLDDSTRGLISESRISFMKPTAVLLNYARGGILDEQATCHRLQQGLLAGVAIDVFEGEPRISSPLIGMPKVLSTSHIGGSTQEAVMAMGRAAISQLLNAYFPAEFSDQSDPYIADQTGSAS